MTTTIVIEGDIAPVFTPTDQPMATSSYIDLALIDPNPQQPRKMFDPDRLKELAGSIREHGVIQPIVVEITDDGSRYTLHAGERRCRAARLAGLETIPAYILPPGTDPKGLLIRATIENVQRADMTPIEEARAYQQMKDAYQMSDADIATQVGKSRSAVANTRRLLQLPQERLDQVDAGALSERQALALLPFYQLPPDVQKVIKQNWNGESMLKNAHELSSDEIRRRYKSAVERETTGIPWPVRDETDGRQIFSLKCIECPMCVAIDTRNYGCADIGCFAAKKNFIGCRQMDRATDDTGLQGLDPTQTYAYSDVTKFWDHIADNHGAAEAALDKKCPNLYLYASEYSKSYIGPDGHDGIIYACYHPEKGKCACLAAHLNTSNADESRAEKARKAGLHSLRDRTANALSLELQKIPIKLLGMLGAKSLPPYSNKHEKLAAAIANDEIDLAAGIVSSALSGSWVSDYMTVDKAHENLIEKLTPWGLADLVPPEQEQ